MKRKFVIFPLLMMLLSIAFSCKDKGKSFEELKSEEVKKIKNFIAREGIEVLKEYPANGVFGAKQFVELSNGIYLNVVDSGTGDRAVLGKTTVLVRCSGQFLREDTTYAFSTFPNDVAVLSDESGTYSMYSYPIEFKYGYAATVIGQHANAGDLYYYFLSLGMESILSYVGDSAIVKMIIPAYAEMNSYQVASSTYQSANSQEYIPIYFDKLRYVFKK